MADDSDNSPAPAGRSQPPSTSATQHNPPPEHASSLPMSPVLDRSELLDRARHFLGSPQVVHQDHESKRRFLTDKGLTDGEIQLLLREMPSQLPLVPPRMYPAPPPSRLPGLLAGTFKLLSWIAGGSTALLFIYYRFLLPRLARSALAQRSLKAHQNNLFAKLAESLRDFQDEQKVAYVDLPRPDPWGEALEPWGKCRNLGDVVAATQGEQQSRVVPHVTLLRCALADLAGQNKPSTTDEIFQALFSSELPSLLNIDDAYQESLWKTLNDAPLFRGHIHAPDPVPQPTSPLLPALAKLHISVSCARRLFDFTGFLTTKTYALASAMHRLPGTTPPSPMPIEEEEVRTEIKALKGLVLNRRTFMPTIPRPSSAPADKA
ncbi:hypothetical protein H4582DRAFT_1896987 [Lactarius indigo]|nr:hypothetical protein H4582DRAFT_1896987 [Lactarius indigo]